MNDDDKLLEIVNKHSAATLNQLKNIDEAHLVRIIAGQLKSTIKVHGPVTMENIGSAAKRIACQLLSVI